MERRELVRRLVLNSICDDFENIDQIILPTVREDGARLGLTIERTEVVDTLAGLVADGLAKAYLLSTPADDPFSTEIPGMPPVDVPEENFETYFYPTRKGMDLHLSDDTWWPFADEAETTE
jgi:hypothetical protein